MNPTSSSPQLSCSARSERGVRQPVAGVKTLASRLGDTLGYVRVSAKCSYEIDAG